MSSIRLKNVTLVIDKDRLQDSESLRKELQELLAPLLSALEIPIILTSIAQTDFLSNTVLLVVEPGE